MPDSVLTVGLDVGTTSTHLVFSRLHVANERTPDQVPRMVVRQREIVYRSPVYLTPLTGDSRIDAARVTELVKTEYARAGVDSSQIQCGAAIITGESARLRNAESVINQLAAFTGHFVAASAGPHLESILAGRGSGAAQASKDRQCTICNIDIGGGTTNIAVFENGEIVDTACIGIGGRCLRIDPDGYLLGCTDSGELFLDGVRKLVPIGHRFKQEELEHIGYLLAEAIVQDVACSKPPQITERLLITDSLKSDYTVDEFWFSGGVAEMMAHPQIDFLAYGDIGGYLADGLRASVSERALSVYIPDEPIRATVIGAGMYSMQLSGTTVAADENSLPLKNIPIIRPFRVPVEPPTDLVAYVKGSICDSLLRHDLNWQEAPVAVALSPIASPSFDEADRWARALSAAFESLNAMEPFLLISPQDIAMALGQLIRKYLPGKQLVILDGLSTETGDYLDIGKPINNHLALPVIVKDLIFQR